MNQPRKRISLKSISPERQALIVCMHQKQFGTVKNLPVVNREPQIQQASILKKRNLAKQAVAKPESRNFILKVAHLRLLETLDELQNGTIELITFRDGLPCELEESAV